MFGLRTAFLAALGGLVSTGPAIGFAPFSAPGQAQNLSTGQRRVQEALASPTSLACQQAPLDKVLDYLGRLHGVAIKLDRSSLAAAGIAPDVPVTEALEGITLRSALRRALRDLGLAYTIEGGAIVVLSEADAEKRLYTAAYPVGDLVGARAAAGSMKLDTAGLVRAMRQAIAPETWKSDETDGRGLVRAVPPGEARLLAVTQTGPVQERVADFLEHVRFAVRSKSGRPTAAAERGSIRFAAEERIRQVLEGPANEKLSFVECPLQQVAAEVQTLHRIPVRLDRRALDEVGIAADTPVTAKLKGLPLGSALRLTLLDLDLVYVIDNEVLLVTTPEDAESRLLSTRFHVVDDPPERRGPSGLHRVQDDDLVDLITSIVTPTSWDDVGGPGIVGVVRKDAARSLVVTQSQAVHGQVDDLLDLLRRAATGPSAMQPDGTVNVPRFAERRIQKALQSPTTIEFIATPLADVIEHLEKLHAIAIRVDKRALDDVGIGTDTPITCNLKDLSLESALRHVLRETDLTFIIADDVLLITTPEQAESRLATRVHLATDLMPTGAVPSRLRREGPFPPMGIPVVGFLAADADPNVALEWLVDAITSTVFPTTWDSVGGPGSIVPVSLGVEKVLAVSQTDDVHSELAALLGELRRVAAAEARGGASKPGPGESVPPEGPGLVTPADARIVKTLDQPTAVEFLELPVRDAMDYLKDLHGIEIQVDKKALDDVGIGTDTPITMNLKGVSLRAGLEVMLRSLDLTFVVRGGALLITTPEEAESHLLLRVYPVTDLVRRPGGEPDFDSLIDTITSTIRPTTWDDVGGPGSIAPLTVGRTHVLIFGQTQQVHEEVATLLARLRVAGGLVKRPEGGPARAPSPEERIAKALRSPVTLEVKETPLADVLDALKKQGGIPIQVDKKGLDDVGIGSDTPVTCSLRQATLEGALAHVLDGVKLKYLVDREYILVTTEEEADARLVTEVYRVDWGSASRVAPGAASGDFDTLISALRERVAPDTWDEVGGPGSIAQLEVGRNHVLVVSQTWEVQRQVAKALGTNPVQAP